MILRRLAILPALFALSAFPALCAEAPAPQEDPVKSLPAGTTYEIGPGAKGVRVPLERNDKVTGALQAVLLDAALGTERNPALRAEFQPPRIDDGGALAIGIPNAPLRQGTYDLRIEVRGGGSKPQILALRITQPAAQLRATDTLIIDRSVGLFGTDEKKPPLLLTETSGHSPLRNVRVQAIENPPGVNGKDGPALTFTPIQTIPVGETGSAFYSFRPVGDLSLGSVQGHAQVLSPQLATPVPVTFEIHTRRTGSWILVLALLGLGCGLLLRTLLPQWVSRDQARLQGLDGLAALDRETARRKDGTFQNHVITIRKDLEARINAKPPLGPEDLGAAVTAAADALKKEVADLTVRITTAEQETERLGRLVETGWFLPADFDQERQKGQEDLGDARSALLQSDAQTAQGALSSARQHLAGLAGRIRDWPNLLEGLLETLELPALPVPAGMQAGLKDSVARVRGSIDVPDPGVVPAFEPLSQSLEAIHKARTGARELLLRIRPGIETLLADVTAALRPLSAPGGDPLAGLRGPVQSWLRELTAAAAVPETATPAVRAFLDGLDTVLGNLLLSKVPAGDGRKAVQAKLDQRDYGGAAREAVRVVREAAEEARKAAFSKGEGNLQGDLEVEEKSARESAEELAPAAPWMGIAGVRFDLPSWTSQRLPLDLSPGALGITRSRIVQELAQVTWLRTGLTWIGLLWLAFVLFHDKAGTVQDFAEVFFWGFGTDVTVDAFWTAAKGYKKV